MRVLIVETDWRFVNQAVEYLEARAHDVVLQPNPREAIELSRRWRPDLVIAASQFGQTGLLEALHGMPERPAVLLTGAMARYDLAWKAWQRGGDELLMKPIFRIGELREAIVAARQIAVSGGRRLRAPVLACA